LILITEMLFTVIPHALFLLTNNAVVPFLQLRVISLIGIGYSTGRKVYRCFLITKFSDALVTTIVYWTTWLRVICPSKVQPSITVLNANANQMATSATTGDWFECIRKRVEVIIIWYFLGYLSYVIDKVDCTFSTFSGAQLIIFFEPSFTLFLILKKSRM
jgi:hypothetical protein